MDTDASAGALGALAALLSGGFLLVVLAVAVLMVASIWKVFAKAGQPGWAAIVPIYNAVVLLQIVGRPLWWIVLMLIPFVGVVMAFIVNIDLAKSFGKGAGFGVGLVLLSFVFFPILGFGSARYQGPSSMAAAAAA
jgi:hypothetical protein